MVRTIPFIKLLALATSHPLMHVVWLSFAAAAAAVFSVLAALLQVQGQAMWLLSDS